MKNAYVLIDAPLLKYCQVCGAPLKSKKIDLKQEKAHHVFIMEKVPAYICENCQEVWIPNIILDEFKNYVNLRGVKHGRKKD